MPGAGTAEQSGSQAFSETSKTTFEGASPQEQALLDQFVQLGGTQQQTLQDIMERLQGGAFAMSPADQATLDKSYEGARQQLQLQGKDYADYLAGGRGLRMSDTPISQQALERYGLGLSALESDKARASLDYGLAGNQYLTNAGLMAAQALPAGMVAGFNPLFSERMASGTTTRSGTGSSNQSYTQPLMQTILQGTQAFGNLSQAVAPATGKGGISSFFG